MREWGAEDKKEETIKRTSQENLESPIDLEEPFEKQKVNTKRIIPKKRKINFFRIVIIIIAWYFVIRYGINPGFIGLNMPTVCVIITSIITFREIKKFM